MSVLHFDFGMGRLVPVDEGALPVGALLSYEDRANPMQKYAVIGHRGGHNILIAEDGHESSIYKSSLEGPGGWRNLHKVLDAAALGEFVRAAEKNKIRIEAEEKAEAEREADESAKARAAALEEGLALGLEPVRKDESALRAASRNLKKELSARFPGVKFSVKSDRFSGGNSLDVSYRNGPPWEVVDGIAKKYAGGSFNGMEDIYEYSRGAWASVFGDAKYVHASRGFGRDYDHESAIMKEMEAEVKRLYEVADDKAYRDRMGRWPSDHVREALHKAAIPPGWEIVRIDSAKMDGALFKIVIRKEGGAL